MPFAPPRIASCCGRKVAYGALCPCQAERQRQRKARFDRTRPSARERGYDARWDTERKAFLAAHPHCARCSAPATVVDHIMAHKGNQALFWNKANWQPLCQSCHNRSKQAEEKRRCE